MLPTPDPTPLLQLQQVGKAYPLVHKGTGPLEQVWARLRGRTPRQLFQALQDISLDVLPGQSLGLIGMNGAGKSTLLKIMAGVVKPSQGRLQRRGRIGALLELGAGFHPDYTGRENILLASALMGMSRAETESRIDNILAFADIGEHIDQPLKHYSSGMVVRLGFAVATSVVPDVLITDEVLAVGDESFQKKCIRWMEDFLGQGGTLLLCSHSMYHIQKLCQRAAWIDAGRLRLLGDAQQVTQAYLAWHEERARDEKGGDSAQLRAVQADKQGLYHVTGMHINGQDTVEPLVLNMGADLRVHATLHSPDDRCPQVAVGIVRADGTPVYGVVSDMDGHTPRREHPGCYSSSLLFNRLPLLPGRYQVRVHAMDPEGMRLFDQMERPFEVQGQSRELGFCRLDHQWMNN